MNGLTSTEWARLIGDDFQYDGFGGLKGENSKPGGKASPDLSGFCPIRVVWQMK
jgi:hypothetical protein